MTGRAARTPGQRWTFTPTAFVALAFLWISGSSCGDSTNPVDKWGVYKMGLLDAPAKYEPSAVEFFEDGTCRLRGDDAPIGCEWTALEGSRIKVTAQVLGSSVVLMVGKVSGDRILVEEESEHLVRMGSEDQRMIEQSWRADQLNERGRDLQNRGKADEARTAYEEASQLGSIFAKQNLARMLATGNGGPKDMPGAIDLYRDAADAGNVWSMVDLAWYYTTGSGTERDAREAIKLYERALKTSGFGDEMRSRALAGASWLYATCERDGLRDLEKALAYAVEASELTPQAWYAWTSLATARAQLGEFAEAADAQKKGVDLLRRDSQLAKHERDSKLDQAQGYLERLHQKRATPPEPCQ